jgi:hypothetical protein
MVVYRAAIAGASRHQPRSRWFAFQREALMEEARRWLASFDIEPLYEPRSAQARPVTEVPAPPKIGLLDLVLFGAPDGKTELLEGRVLRQIHAPTPSEVRSIFRRLACELCWFFDQPWRRRCVEGRSAFDLERAHLVVDGDVVQFRVEVPIATTCQ